MALLRAQRQSHRTAASPGPGILVRRDGGTAGGRGVAHAGSSSSDNNAAAATGGLASPPAELLLQYIHAVFGGAGAGPADHLMHCIAAALAKAGRPAPRGAAAASSEAAAAAAQAGERRYSLPLAALVAHITREAPALVAVASGAGVAAGAALHEGALMQRLRERASKGCFRVLQADDADGEAVAALDVEVLMGRAVEALQVPRPACWRHGGQGLLACK